MFLSDIIYTIALFRISEVVRKLVNHLKCFLNIFTISQNDLIRLKIEIYFFFYDDFKI